MVSESLILSEAPGARHLSGSGEIAGNTMHRVAA